MNPERWRQVEEIFHQALALSTMERDSFLVKACAGDDELRAEVVSLLESDGASAGQFVGSQIRNAVIELNQAAEGRRVGSYRLVRELGKGGMGTVYLAVRADDQYDSEVAIKLVQPGLDTEFILRRFRRERQILAWLQHSNIARLLDSGATEDGSSYLVMEYVDGEWITNYAAQNRLSVEQRLRLFLPVCDAVEFAHRHFVIHRDLKPGNILVDRYGVPKLLDFGISKLLFSNQGEAETGSAALMTPAYASPEQISGDPVTIVSDVYSLGTVLYELLTGSRAHRIDSCAPLALEQAICVEKPPLPSVAAQPNGAFARRLAGDLDSIIQRALHKEPVRRYPSVRELADDIRRHLEDRPVTARPDSFGYRAAKFVKRNRVAVTLAVLLGGSLVAGAAVSWHQARLAGARFQQVRRLAGTFLFDVEAAVRPLPGSRHVRQLIARTGWEYLDSLAQNVGGDLTLKREIAAAYERIGDVEGGPRYPNFGDFESALGHYRRAEVLLREILQESPTDRQALRQHLSVLFNIGELQRQNNDNQASMATYQDGLRRSEAALAASPDDLDLIEDAEAFQQQISILLRSAGDLSGAMNHASEALRKATRIASARPNDRSARLNLATAYSQLAGVHAALGHTSQAVEYYGRAVSGCEAFSRQFPNDTDALRQLMLAYGNLGDKLGNPIFDNVGDTAAALNAYSKMVAVARRLHDADPADGRAMTEYGVALLRFGAITPARQATEKWTRLNQSFEFLTRAASQNPANTVTARNKAWAAELLGDISADAGDRTAADRYYEIALTTLEAVLATNPKDVSPLPRLVSAAGKLAHTRALSGRRDPALAAIDRLLRASKTIDDLPAHAASSSRASLARSYQAAGSVHELLSRSGGAAIDGRRDRDSALAWYRMAVAEWRSLEKKPGFPAADRKEMEKAAAALIELEAAMQRSLP